MQFYNSDKEQMEDKELDREDLVEDVGLLDSEGRSFSTGSEEIFGESGLAIDCLVSGWGLLSGISGLGVGRWN